MINLFSKDTKEKYTPEEQELIFCDIYLQKQCRDNESIVITDDGLRNGLHMLLIEYKSIVAKKAVAEDLKLPLYLMFAIDDAAKIAILNSILRKFRGEQKK